MKYYSAKPIFIYILISASVSHSTGDINSLMPELRSLILSNAGPRDILNFCATSKAQRGLCAPDTLLWKLLITRDFGDSFTNAIELFQSWKDLYMHLFKTRRMMNMAAGNGHHVLLDAHGQVWTFGKGFIGQLGHGNTKNLEMPTKIENLPAKIIAVAAGVYHTALLDIHGQVWTHGQGYWGQLGHGDAQRQAVPKKIEGLPSKIVFMAAVERYTVLLDTDGEVWTFGGEISGAERCRPKKIHVPEKIISVAAGSEHTVLLDIHGRVWTFGAGGDGQLGHGDMADQLAPKMIETLPVKIVSVAAGSEHTVLLDTNGGVWTFGAGEEGRLGHGDEENQLVPKQISDLDVKIVAVAAGEDHTVLLDDAGYVWTCGNSLWGQLGYDPDSGDQPTPKQIENLPAKIVGVVAGQFRTLVRDSDGGTWIFGEQDGTIGLPGEETCIPSLITGFSLK